MTLAFAVVGQPWSSDREARQSLSHTAFKKRYRLNVAPEGDSLSDNENVNNLHKNGFSQIWILLWFIKVSLEENGLLQYSHINGFSPV